MSKIQIYKKIFFYFFANENFPETFLQIAITEQLRKADMATKNAYLVLTFSNISQFLGFKWNMLTTKHLYRFWVVQLLQVVRWQDSSLI